jgi:hypothetical protein
MMAALAEGAIARSTKARNASENNKKTMVYLFKLNLSYVSQAHWLAGPRSW